jgi:anti-anti-sigma factor
MADSADQTTMLLVDATSSVVTIAISGEIDIAGHAQIGSDLLAALAGRRPTALVLDLTGVTFIDSSGLAVLIGLRHDGWRVVVKGSETVRRVIQASGLDTYLELVHGEAPPPYTEPSPK